jgi:predicted nucleic acid-binding Zn ribbon protein
MTIKKTRGRQPPPIGVYACTGCVTDKPTIRNEVHVNCSKCGAPPNRQLERLWQLPNWPSVRK